MAPTVGGNHHHRSTTKSSQKPFKSRFMTKSSLRELSKGKIEGNVKLHRKTPHQQMMSKIDRRHQARQKQHNKHLDNDKAIGVFAGRNGAPRNVAIVPLCPDGDAPAAIRKLNACLDLEADVPTSGLFRTNIDRFKQKLEYIIVQRDLIDALNACQVADFVIFLLSSDQEVDELGELMIRTIESQGVSTVLTMVQGMDRIEPAKRRPGIALSLRSYMTHFFPEQEKVYSLDSAQECSNALRSICTATPKGIRWREDRSWMLVENVRWPKVAEQNGDGDKGEVIITGVVRGKRLKADRLVHVGDWGEFQIGKIVTAPLVHSRKTRPELMAIDASDELIDVPTNDQDDMAELAPEDVTMNDQDNDMISEAPSQPKGVLLDDHHYFSDDETHLPKPPKRLPKGTSSYQAAWFLDDVPNSDSEAEDNPEDQDGDFLMKPPALPQDGLEGLASKSRCEPTEFDPSETTPSEMFVDPAPDDAAETQQLAAFRSRKNQEAAEDLEFPDEIELHPNVSARERLARYRGLKSLRTSHWEVDEDRAHEPEDWRRLLHIADYKNSKSQVLSESLIGGVEAGTRVAIHLRDVPLSLETSEPSPCTLFALLRHEHKRAVVNYSISLDSEHPSPVKSKEELILQCGPRRFIINPSFSQAGHTPNNVHKFERYLHPGRTAIATFIAPLTWGSVPALIFKRTESAESADATTGPHLKLIGTGTCLPPDHDRVLAKRVILTGHPYKIHKKLVTVRYMFFNVEDVQWFKALQLWTKRGRSGFIRESLGTHGYFKATFDAKINPQDAVGVSLYKRVFPRTASAWRRA